MRNFRLRSSSKGRKDGIQPDERLQLEGSVLKTRRSVSRALVDQSFLRADFRADFVLPQLRRHWLSFCLTGAILIGAGATLVAKSPSTAGDAPTSPVLVELFTSEGCSSCPPADALVEQMDASQPVPGVQLIVLSEHVDYWDHDGWKDPYSSSSLTDRQNSYVRALGLKTPYTPQILIDGTAELPANNAQQVSEMLQKARTTPKVPIHITSATLDAGPSVVRGHIEADGSSAKHNADVYAVVALDHAESQVSKGENSGRHLTYVAVVLEITKVGKLEKGKNFSHDFQVKFKRPQTDPMPMRVVAVVQESGSGKVLGATLQKITN
jgi:hypothetical protein